MKIMSKINLGSIPVTDRLYFSSFEHAAVKLQKCFVDYGSSALTSRQHEGEKIMTEISFMGELIL